jgi:hypothetical protein
MKFDLMVSELLNEMPHIGFSDKGSTIGIDLEMEKFQKDYDGFLNHVKQIIFKLNSDSAKQTFLKELKLNKPFNLFLNKLYSKDYNSFLSDLNY